MSQNVSLPLTMRAWTYTSRGSTASILHFRSDLPTPTPGSLAAGEVLIRTSHVGFNVGLIVLFQLMPHFNTTPWIPELEFSGTVVAVGASVTDLQPGDPVIGAQNLRTHLRHGGTLAEYLVMPAEIVVPRPANSSMAEAAGILGVGCTAVQAAELARLKKGDKVFVNGGSGGLGTMMVQVAKAIVGENGRVVATCSGPNVELVKSLGADEVIDYTLHQSLPDHLAINHSNIPFTSIIDTVGSQDLYTHSPLYLVQRGPVVNLGGMGVSKDPSIYAFASWALEQARNRLLPVMFGGIPRAYLFYSATPQRKSFFEVIELVKSGKVKGIVDNDHIWNMEEGLKAYDRVQSQRARGKVIIKVERS